MPSGQILDLSLENKLFRKWLIWKVIHISLDVWKCKFRFGHYFSQKSVKTNSVNSFLPVMIPRFLVNSNEFSSIGFPYDLLRWLSEIIWPLSLKKSLILIASKASEALEGFELTTTNLIGSGESIRYETNVQMLYLLCDHKILPGMFQLYLVNVHKYNPFAWHHNWKNSTLCSECWL